MRHMSTKWLIYIIYNRFIKEGILIHKKLKLMRIPFYHRDKFYAIFWEKFRWESMHRTYTDKIMDWKCNARMDLDCVIKSFAELEPWSAYRKSKDIDRFFWVDECVSRIEKFLIDEVSCIRKPRKWCMDDCMLMSYSYKRNLSKLNSFFIMDYCVGNSRFIEQSTNRGIRKNCYFFISLEEQSKRIEMIMICVLMREENGVNMFEFWMSFSRKSSWICQDPLSLGLYEETTMSEFGDFHIRIIPASRF